MYIKQFNIKNFRVFDEISLLLNKGINIIIGENSTIESSVNMTGSDEFPLRIGKNVLIKGTSYLFGSVIEDDVTIEHSVLIKKKVKAEKDKDGKIKPVKFFIPDIEGKELLSDI
jgi:bifunctional UDP-N-acetylglucosamine pyrophosphorylase/glucosamine-1-phosphate N-acetyltransferase